MLGPQAHHQNHHHHLSRCNLWYVMGVDVGDIIAHVAQKGKPPHLEVQK